MEMYFPTLAMRPISRTIFALVLTLLSINASAEDLPGFTAKYKAYYFGKERGEANLALESLGQDQYKLTYNSKVSAFFLTDRRQEESLFTFKDNTITPSKYQYKRSGTGKDKSLQAEFDGEANRITMGESSLPWQGELDNQLYRLDLQLKLASGAKDFEYSLLNSRGEIRHYKLLVLGKEQLQLPYGLLEGIKVKIMRESKRRETYAWFSPELNYQLVRLQQFKEGEEQGDIRLSDYSSRQLPDLTQR